MQARKQQHDWLKMWEIIVFHVQHAVKYIFFQNFPKQLKTHQEPSANPVIRYLAHDEKISTVNK